MRVEPITRTSLVDVVIERIRQVIDEGGMTSGDRLPSESELVESLQVSRTVLREAIGRLETMGLLDGAARTRHVRRRPQQPVELRQAGSQCRQHRAARS